MRALAKDPAWRYPSAQAMAATLGQTLAALEMAGAAPEGARDHAPYVHTIVQRAPADDWRVLAERLREREVVTAPVGVMQPLDDATSSEADVQADILGGQDAGSLPLRERTWHPNVRRALLALRKRMPTNPAQRLLVTTCTALLFLVGILLLHHLV
jgi:hypothetical protein